MKKDKYTEHLLNSVHKSREIAIRELPTMGVNQIKHLESIENWYTSVIDRIRHDPPNYYVKILEIDEDSYSEIKNLSYCYHIKGAVVCEPTIRLHIDMSTNS